MVATFELDRSSIDFPFARGAVFSFEIGPVVVPTIPATLSLSASTLPNDGGYELTLVSAAIADGTYNVHVGPAGDQSDLMCYSGVIGRGGIIEFVGGIGTVIIPPLPIGGPYLFTFVRLSAAAYAINVSDPALTIIAHHFKSHTHRLRRLMPPLYRTGARSTELEVYPQS